MTPSLPDALRGYLQYLVVERGLAPNTVESYRRDLRRYASLLASRGKTRLGEVTAADVAEFLASLREGDDVRDLRVRTRFVAGSEGRRCIVVPPAERANRRDRRPEPRQPDPLGG